MTTSLLAVIACLLFALAAQARHHDRAMAAAELRWSMHPQLMFIPTPAPPAPFLLERRVVDAPTRPITPGRLPAFTLQHPRFENYGVDVSVAPTIGIV